MLGRRSCRLPVGSGTDGSPTILPTIRVPGIRHADRPCRGRTACIDNAALRSAFRDGVTHRNGSRRAGRAGGARHHRVVLAASGVIEARLVIDAAGWPSRFAPEAAGRAAPCSRRGRRRSESCCPNRPTGDLGTATLMDFRPAPGGAADRASTIGPAGVTSFAYSLPVVDGWLVEETVLAGASGGGAGRPARSAGGTAGTASGRPARERRAQ